MWPAGQIWPRMPLSGRPSSSSHLTSHHHHHHHAYLCCTAVCSSPVWSDGDGGPVRACGSSRSRWAQHRSTPNARSLARPSGFISTQLDTATTTSFSCPQQQCQSKRTTCHKLQPPKRILGSFLDVPALVFPPCIQVQHKFSIMDSAVHNNHMTPDHLFIFFYLLLLLLNLSKETDFHDSMETVLDESSKHNKTKYIVLSLMLCYLNFIFSHSKRKYIIETFFLKKISACNFLEILLPPVALLWPLHCPSLLLSSSLFFTSPSKILHNVYTPRILKISSPIYHSLHFFIVLTEISKNIFFLTKYFSHLQIANYFYIRANKYVSQLHFTSRGNMIFFIFV